MEVPYSMSQSFTEKVKRVTSISNIWMSSVSPHPPILSPLHYSWKITTEKRFELLWYDGEICLRKLNIVIGTDDHDSENEDIEKVSLINLCTFKCFVNMNF